VRAFVIVVLDPEGGTFHSLLEAVELGTLEKFPQDRFPETFDLAQRHGMVGAGTDVLDTVFFHLPFETGFATPVGVLAPVVGEHLFGNTVFGNATPVGLQDVGRRLAAVQPQGGDIPAVIVHEADQVGVATRQPEGHDVALPQLVGTGSFEESGFGRILLWLALYLVDQPLVRQRSMNRRWAGSHQEKSFEDIGNPARAVIRVGLFNSHHSFLNFGGHPGVDPGSRLNLQTVDASLSIGPDPSVDR
jgi:hypothetical protein